MDIWSKEKRSLVMSKIGCKNTKPELLLRSLLFRKGFRYRIHQKNLAGKPDIVLKKYNTIIFVHGCFWHYHKDCQAGKIPSSNTKFWKDKLERNVEKDQQNVELLQKDGWKVLEIWECEIENTPEETLNKIIDNLKKLDRV